VEDLSCPPFLSCSQRASCCRYSFSVIQDFSTFRRISYVLHFFTCFIFGGTSPISTYSFEVAPPSLLVSVLFRHEIFFLASYRHEVVFSSLPRAVVPRACFPFLLRQLDARLPVATLQLATATFLLPSIVGSLLPLTRSCAFVFGTLLFYLFVGPPPPLPRPSCLPFLLSLQ